MVKNKEIEKIKLFVSEMINKEQNDHSGLLLKLNIVSGKTQEYDNMVKILNQIFDAKIKILNKIYKEL